MLAYTLMLPVWIPLGWVRAVFADAADMSIGAKRPEADPGEPCGQRADPPRHSPARKSGASCRTTISRGAGRRAPPPLFD